MKTEKINYAEYSDEKIVSMAKEGDSKAEAFLLIKYRNMVRSRARTYFLSGGDNDDLIQEGMIGLYKAIHTYENDKDASFMTYAGICINNRMLSAVTVDNRKKNAPLNGYVSIYTLIMDETGEEALLSDVLPSHRECNPENILLDREQESIIEKNIGGKLSNLEKTILSYYMEGLSYAQIARCVDKTEKSVDNAIQRIRLKLKNLYS